MNNRDILADLHTHTIASSHAFSTIGENIAEAKSVGLKYLAITDHHTIGTGLGLDDKQERARLKTLNGDVARPYTPESRLGLISGTELNFGESIDGTYSDVVMTLGLRLGGFHGWFYPFSTSNIKDAFENVQRHISKTPIDIFVHPERDIQKLFENDYEYKRKYLLWVVDYCVRNNIILELNEKSLADKSNHELISFWLKEAKARSCRLSLGSDAHFYINIGKFDKSILLLNKINYPKNLIVNIDEDWLTSLAKPYNNG